ncbi:MAG TPA: hypothetical protein VKH15_14460 [Candidatus Acidoferrum sp.]|nr:hypothetical protein [Candidatus Acidoferrum sp.]
MIMNTKKFWARYRRYPAAILLTGVATAAIAGGQKSPIIATAKPSADGYDLGESVNATLTISNRGQGRISFHTCGGYSISVEVRNERGAPVPVSEPARPVRKDGELILPPDPIDSLPICVSDQIVIVIPGESWSRVLSVNSYADLKTPGVYSARIVWSPGNLIDTEAASNWFQFTIRAKAKK